MTMTMAPPMDSLSYGSVTPLSHELLHHAFEAQAEYHPDSSAVEFENDNLTYGQLNSQANSVAAALAALQVGAGMRVAVIMDRSLEFPIGLLAALKVGASMMPIDATFPAARLTFMLADANVAAVITTEDFRDRIQELKLSIPVLVIRSSDLASAPVAFEPSPHHVAMRHDEAFVVYTSGSTGKPKGVPVLHEGAVNVIVHSATEAKIERGVRVMQFMAIGFDVCQWETWKTLSFGATLVFRTDNFQATMLTVDVLVCTPTGLSLFGHPSKYPNLKCVCVAGECVPEQLKDLWAEHAMFMNVYGPSECSISSHFVRLEKHSPVSVGAPLPNVNAYV
ncbi:hypothetical protein As57867_007525, partial [Aphanomyces stellatus]